MNLHKDVSVYVAETDPVRGSIMKRDKASFVLCVDVGPVF